MWDPYEQQKGNHPCHDVAFYTGCLKCMDIVEPYHHESVQRNYMTNEIIIDVELGYFTNWYTGIRKFGGGMSN